VWEGIPTATSEPKFTLPAQMPKRIASDGESLVVIVNEQKVVVYQIADLSSGSLPSTVPTTRGNPASSFNLPGKAIPSQGHLFVADTGFNRVLIWNRIADALAGRTADVILGTASLQDISPEIGADKLFWPGSLTFDGSYLWVGEFKFSERILRFSIHKPP